MVTNNDNCEMNTFAIKHIPDHPITPGKQERLLSANTKENEKQLKMEISELEELAGKLEKEIHDKKAFWAELQILKKKGFTSSKLMDELQNLEAEINSKEEERTNAIEKRSALDNIIFGLTPIQDDKRKSCGFEEANGNSYVPSIQKTTYYI